jgi:heme/copper-type cytochrome/quinol oxidase subunit 4
LYLTHQPWGDLGIDLGLGLPMDKTASPYEYMFLPDYVESGFKNASIENNGITEPLVKERKVLYESQHNTPPRTLIHPLLVFGVVFLFVGFISYRDMKRRKITQWLDIILFTLVGFLGFLLFLLWIATDHKAAARNLNLLWALPTHLIAIMAMIRNPKWLMHYFLVTAIIALIVLAGWPFLPQKLHFSLIPLVMALGVRAFTQYIIRKEVQRQERKNPLPA